MAFDMSPTLFPSTACAIPSHKASSPAFKNSIFSACNLSPVPRPLTNTLQAQSVCQPLYSTAKSILTKSPLTNFLSVGIPCTTCSLVVTHVANLYPGTLLYDKSPPNL